MSDDNINEILFETIDFIWNNNTLVSGTDQFIRFKQ